MAEKNWEAICDKQLDTIERLQAKVDCYEDTIKSINHSNSSLRKENERQSIQILTLKDTIKTIVKEIKNNG